MLSRCPLDTPGGGAGRSARTTSPETTSPKRNPVMPNFTRRQALAVGSGLVTSMIAPIRGASAAGGDTLTIAYNVNLPSFDPNVGPSSVNPTIQAIYRSIFDQFIGQRPDLS